MDQVESQEGLLKIASLEDRISDKWCLVMFISCEDEQGHKSVSLPIYIGLLAGDQMVQTEDDVKTHLKAEWEKPAAEANIVVTLCKSLLQTPKFDDLSVAKQLIKLLTRVIDWDTWPGEIASEISFGRVDDKITGVRIIPLQVSLQFDLEHSLDVELQASMKDMLADIEGLDDRLLIAKFGHA